MLNNENRVAVTRHPEPTPDSGKNESPSYTRPSYERAQAFKIDHYVTFTPTGREADRRLYDCCVPTGRYCNKSGATCDICCEGRVSSFAEYGSGTTAFFKNIKALGERWGGGGWG